MEAETIAKQIIGFHRTMFNNTCNAITVMQDSSESMMNGFLKQFPWITDDARKPLNDSISFMKESNKNYQKMVNEGFQHLAGMTELADQNLPNMERLFFTAGQRIKKEQPLKKASTRPQPPPQPKAGARKVAAVKKTVAATASAAEKLVQSAQAKPAVEPAVMAKAAPPQLLVTDQPLARQPIAKDKPIGPKP